MAQIQVTDLTFSYDGNNDEILRDVSFNIDTNWKLGLFEKNMEDYSEGQKKKVLIGAGLITPAHLYIWDEPLNYIDVFSRIQIEKLIADYEPTMLIVEHDVCFQKKVATNIINI